MMKLVEHFDAFLQNKVNLSEARVLKLDQRVAAVTNFLSSGDDIIAQNFKDLIPQGSYAQRTIINPVVSGDKFDADVLLDMDEIDGWAPQDYIEKLYSVFRSSGTYREMVSRKSRCVTIDYVGEFHVDVVPYLTRHGQSYITNRNENKFELTNPEGFNAWLDECNRISRGRLVKVIRLLKYIRDFKNTFSLKSVILTILVGNRVSDAAIWADADHYKDVPTALVNLLGDLNDYLQAFPLMPSIDDPSCLTENFNHRWDQEQYSNFRNCIKTYSEWARDAYDETDREESYRKWRRLFGDQFGTYAAISSKSALGHRGLEFVNDSEEFVEKKFTVALQLAYKVKLEARTAPKDGWRSYILASRGNIVAQNRSLIFKIKSMNVPPPYEIWWKVRNVGEEAIRRNMIRGQIVKDSGSRQITESASFRGNHYVEVYILKDGVVVARDRQSVVIS